MEATRGGAEDGVTSRCRSLAESTRAKGDAVSPIELLRWIAPLVQTVVYGTLVNVVRVEQLWPRSITRSDLGRGDQRAAELSAARAALLERPASAAGQWRSRCAADD